MSTFEKMLRIFPKIPRVHSSLFDTTYLKTYWTAAILRKEAYPMYRMNNRRLER